MYCFILSLVEKDREKQIYSVCYNFYKSKMIRKSYYFVQLYFKIPLIIFNITKCYVKLRVNVRE